MDKIKLGKLNAFDLAILLLILICIILMLVKFIPSKVENVSIDMTSNKFTYTVLVEAVSETSGEMVKVGDSLYDKVSSTCIGEVTDVKVTPAMAVFEDTDGSIIRAEKPSKINLEMTVTTDGTVKNGEYLANNLIRILVGQNKQFKTKYWMAEGVVTDIK